MTEVEFQRLKTLITKEFREKEKMSNNCSWPDCENTIIHGDNEAMTEFGEMCTYHKAMITIHNRIPPNTNANTRKS